MKIDENELSHELDLAQETDGVSSFEDFWMFISFAMMVIVFVLMGYVNYLNTRDVKAIKKTRPSTSSEGSQSEAPAAKTIDIYVRKNNDVFYFTIGEDTEEGISYIDLAEAIHKNAKDIEGDKVVFNIYAPTEYSYGDVMKLYFFLESPEVFGTEIMGKDKNIMKEISFVYEEVVEE
jgi:hypothetical protein